MSEVKYAGEEWRYEDDGWITNGDEPVCMIHSGVSFDNLSEEDKERSKIICAAPDLLEALKLLHAHIFGPTTGVQRHEIDDKCRAAIEKAEGRS